MDSLQTKPLVSELGDIVDFDIAPVITQEENHLVVDLWRIRRYEGTEISTGFFKRILTDYFTELCPLKHNKAFDRIISYDLDIKWIEGNKDFYVIRGKIKLKEPD